MRPRTYQDEIEQAAKRFTDKVLFLLLQAVLAHKQGEARVTSPQMEFSYVWDRQRPAEVKKARKWFNLMLKEGYKAHFQAYGKDTPSCLTRFTNEPGTIDLVAPELSGMVRYRPRMIRLSPSP